MQECALNFAHVINRSESLKFHGSVTSSGISVEWTHADNRLKRFCEATTLETGAYAHAKEQEETGQGHVRDLPEEGARLGSRGAETGGANATVGGHRKSGVGR